MSQDNDVAKKGGEHDPRPSRRSREPDVVVVVGGKEFKESSLVLRQWCDYFDAALRSGLKEAQSMRFEFPDQDPEEWKLLMSVLAPFTKVKVTCDNLDIILRWSDQLCIPDCLEECDVCLCDMIVKVKYTETESTITMVVETLSKSLQYSLWRTKRECLEIVRCILIEAPDWLDKKTVDSILELMASHPGYQEEVWGVFQHYLPTTIAEYGEQDTIVRSGLLQSVIVAEVHRRKTQKMVDIAARINSSKAFNWEASMTNFLVEMSRHVKK
jgi:BTB/POZ domain